MSILVEQTTKASSASYQTSVFMLCKQMGEFYGEIALYLRIIGSVS